MPGRMTVFGVARLRRPGLISLYLRTCVPAGRRGQGGRYGGAMSREQLTAAIVTTWETP